MLKQQPSYHHQHPFHPRSTFAHSHLPSPTLSRTHIHLHQSYTASHPRASSHGRYIAAMDSVSIPSETVPPEMKACEQTLKRAKELVKAEPVVAYWCESSSPRRGRTRNEVLRGEQSRSRSAGSATLTAGSFAAAQRALQVANRSGEGTKWLMSLLDALEQVCDAFPSSLALP